MIRVTLECGDAYRRALLSTRNRRDKAAPIPFSAKINMMIRILILLLSLAATCVADSHEHCSEVRIFEQKWRSGGMVDNHCNVPFCF